MPPPPKRTKGGDDAAAASAGAEGNEGSESAEGRSSNSFWDEVASCELLREYIEQGLHTLVPHTHGMGERGTKGARWAAISKDFGEWCAEHGYELSTTVRSLTHRMKALKKKYRTLEHVASTHPAITREMGEHLWPLIQEIMQSEDAVRVSRPEADSSAATKDDKAGQEGASVHPAADGLPAPPLQAMLANEGAAAATAAATPVAVPTHALASAHGGSGSSASAAQPGSGAGAGAGAGAGPSQGPPATSATPGFDSALVARLGEQLQRSHELLLASMEESRKLQREQHVQSLEMLHRLEVMREEHTMRLADLQARALAGLQQQTQEANARLIERIVHELTTRQGQ